MSYLCKELLKIRYYMDKIQMVDLKGQYLKIKDEVDREISEVINSSGFIGGEKVRRFSDNLAKYLDVKHAITCGNGTDALQIALMALGLKPEDEVIVPAFTFIASAEVIALLGLKPVMVDVDYNDFIATAKNIELAITSKTKAIIPVHLFGQGANMEEIIKIAEKYDLYIIEDNAQALGADYIFSDNRRQKLGTIGHIGCTSFFPSKNLGCYGDGGALFTNDDALAEKISMICNHGMKIRYHHEILGVNSRLDAIQAGILDVKLRHLNTYCKSRQDVARAYSHVLKDIDELICPIEREYSTHVYHQYTLKVLNNKRDELREYLDKNGITSMIYYPIPLNRQEAFTGIASMAGDMSVSDKLSSEVLSLPIHTEMNLKTIHYISTKIREFFSK